MISYISWQKLPLHTRVLVATQFGVAKVGPTHVMDNKIASDGYLFESIETALNDVAMKEFTGTTGTSDELFAAVVEKLTVPPVVTPPGPVDPNTVEVSMARPEKIKVAAVEKIKKVVKKAKKK